MYADEAGLTDFLLKSAGHGDVGVNYARLVATNDIENEKVWVTSQSNEYPGAVVDEFLENIDDADVGSGVGGGLLGGTIMGSEDYCAIAARNVTSGNVLWRVNACTSSSSSSGNKPSSSKAFIPRHTTLASTKPSDDTIYSLDNTGILRGWKSTNGALTLDTDIFSTIDAANEHGLSFPGGVPRLLDGTVAIGTVVSKKTRDNDKEEDESLVLLDKGGGHSIKEEGYHHQQSSTSLLSAKMLLSKAKVSGKKHTSARIIDMHLIDEARIAIWVGWSSKDEMGRAVSSFSNMALVEVALTPKPTDRGEVMVYQIVRAVPLTMDASTSSVGAPMVLSSMRMVPHADSTVSMLAIAATNSQLLVTTIDVSTCKSIFGTAVEIDVLHPYWRSIASIHVDNTQNNSAGKGRAIIRVAGLDDRYPTLPRRMEVLFSLQIGDQLSSGNDKALHRVYGDDEEVHQDALAYCANMEMIVAASQNDDGQTVASGYQLESKDSTQRRVTWIPQAIGTTDGSGSGVIVPSTRGGSNSPPGLVQSAHLVECSKDGMTVVFSTLGGMTAAFRFEKSSSDDDSKAGNMEMKHLWSSEEALGSVSSSIFLDETHAAMTMTAGDAENADDEEEKALSSLQFIHRIQSQLSSLQHFVLGGGALSSLKSVAFATDEKKAERNASFGFAKISVLLSQKMHRIVALDTANKGRVVWSMNLHPRAVWHKLVHGGQFVTLNDAHGNGGVHDHEMLSLSYVDSSGAVSSSMSKFVEWKCFDGITGRVFSGDTVPVSTSVMQIVPLRTSTHHPTHEAKSCRQVVLLVHSDKTVSVVPDTARSYAIVDEAMAASATAGTTAGQNGLFVHTVDKESGEFHALRMSRGANGSSSNPFELVSVGTTIFDPTEETIVNVAYPRRGEVIQSPSTVLGDDSLLLKYLNPHIMVVVTEATQSFLSDVAPVSEDGSEENGDGFYNALVGGGQSSGSSGQKRKPLGASTPGGADVPSSSTIAAATPSLFITLVDSVSGQILHRVSHAHALASDLTEQATRVPVVISENWVVYSVFNQRTRRTDVGVLTLHEGMIDKNGITAFSAPEQETSFSSLESAKPIVLSKTFGMTKAVTALGVTTTKAGISNKQFLFATANDQVVSIDRRMLDPRRPNGELKESEKMEGLIRYAPLLPIVPLRTPSHAYEVSSVEYIASASANVESQSLVIAYGGPDVFFTRLAPSKGFDLLPDDFNRGLLSVVLVSLVVLVNVIQRMNKKKMVGTIW
eukprot:CAMPEP_0172317202 /NCGR_PEP_ID=MMETSP1058-20130122/30890_1 /TAXON_ID=83371 /ORGANISM="Detonula confervacea, Strain CCMP 353" /LENGTH=1246 /DNA_ID=CAMNT_0013031711 /DNA_START=73 /DNA_END=3810 /DNA_ORIENTATION=+